MKRFERTPSAWTLAAIAATTALVFFADLLTPLGVAVWVVYLLPVALSFFAWRATAPIVVAAVCTALTVIGYFTSPATVMSPWLPPVNRAIGFVTMWGLAALGVQFIRAKLAVSRQEWLREGHARVAEATEGDLAVEQLSERILRALATYLDASVGSLYVADDDGAPLRRTATVGVERGAAREVFLPGQGLVGRAAAERRVVAAEGDSGEPLPLATSVGAISPVALLAAPAVVERTVRAVVELGFLRRPIDSDIALLELVSPRIALAFRSALDRKQLEDLLGETQQQAEELQTQSEELRVTNEELEQQGVALRESQARLEQQQEELQATNMQLEAQAAELERRSDDLEQSRAELQRRAADLERATRYKSEFLANMSHELRTPLNSSLILSKVLADNGEGNLTPDQVKFASTIYSAGNELLQLIDDILDLSKVEAGQLKLHLERVAVSRVVEALAETFAPVARDRGLGFERAVDPLAAREIVTDEQRLQQILRNLLSNAFKFTHEGGVTLLVSPAGGGRIAFTVKDTGIGIPREQQQAVFEAFRQADGTTSRKYGGTGLGLSISRELATALGGEITLESGPGQGSTFTVTIPLEAPLPGDVAERPTARDEADPGREPAPWRAPQTERAEPAAPAPQGGSERLVLVVEDDPKFAEILCALAKEQRFECVVADRAEEAMRLARERRPAAVVLDVSLPDHSGLTVLERLKRDPATRHVPVHVVSVHDYSEEAMDLGAIGYVLKPVKRDELLQAFSRIEQRLVQQVRRVLVVEDDPVQRESVAKLLGGTAIEVDGVATVADALERLRATAYDCVVLDLGLPGATGDALLDHLGRDELASHPPVVVYTGRSLTGDEEQRLRRHSRSVVVKGARSPERLLDEVMLFLHQVESTLSPEQRRMLADARRRDALLEGRTLLLAEDDARNVFALTAIFEPRGATLEIARNGRAALELLERNPGVELVLMDIMMPEMDGYEAIRRIRADARFAKLPIIALTARARPDDRERCLAAGANDYIAKPIDPDKLLSLVRVWLPRSKR